MPYIRKCKGGGKLTNSKSAYMNLDDNKIAWTPTQEQIDKANITYFMKKHQIRTYEDFLDKAVHEPDWFYPAILEELKITWKKEFEQVMDLTNGIEMPLWFKGGLTNLYDYGLAKHIEEGRGNHPALIWEGEDATSEVITYQELKNETDWLAHGLLKLGIVKGDRVGVLLPQIPDVQTVLFACAKIGAVLVPCFSGFGADAIALRLNDGGAKWLITADGFYRKGKLINLKQVADQAAALVPTIEKVIMIDHIHYRKPDFKVSKNPKDEYYNDLLVMGTEANQQDLEGSEPMKSDEPLMIIYTSGTTGKPKGALHTHYSFPLKNAIDMYFSFDVKPGDRMFWLTDLGWMMGPWHIFGTAILGVTAVMYEGSPDYPNENRLWELMEKHKVTIMGIAPTVIRSLMKFDTEPCKEYDMSSIRILGSTGEPWNPKPWYWYFEKVGGSRCPIINYSGGTEISGGILACVPIKPQKPCSFHGPSPGMAAAVVDEFGQPVTGDQIGDLVITSPFLGMTYSFWQNHERYLNAYWRRWQGIWHHGDFAQIDKEGFWYILGRSDDTMNIAGKRLGPADLESAITTHPNVKESAAIGIPDEVKGEAPILFIVTHREVENEGALIDELKQIISIKLGKSFLPKDMYFVESLPRTQSGKIARRLVRSAYLDHDLGDISTLQNPDSLTEIKKK